MTDKELLELAAKAAGAKWIDETFPYDGFGRMMLDFGDGAIEWNPLTDDGDALRLAVKLGMHVVVDNEGGLVRVYCQSFAKPEEVYGGGEQGNDPYAATRRAIVKAAAEIGRKLND